LLAGDLNDTPESATLVEFSKQWKRANEKISPTIPVGKPTRQIDFVMYRIANGWRVVEPRVLDEAVASDHRATLAVFDLTPVPR
jgi:endonuclease/exonuclease/phosphatase (EEP) superfamily protein YafD